ADISQSPAGNSSGAGHAEFISAVARRAITARQHRAAVGDIDGRFQTQGGTWAAEGCSRLPYRRAHVNPGVTSRGFARPAGDVVDGPPVGNARLGASGRSKESGGQRHNEN